jgi:hypothetical protein
MKKRQTSSGRIEHISGSISATDVYQTVTIVVIANEGDLTDDDAKTFAADLMKPYQPDWFFDSIERVTAAKVLVNYRRRDPIAEMAKVHGGVHVHITGRDGTESTHRQ